ncbi:hypothetical protein PENSPDRAFT_721616 [Peniophora sp. CONT]|nr:hypothetical protein PENSPDRAFT_721616 [Peniophora sp. CONT]
MRKGAAVAPGAYGAHQHHTNLSYVHFTEPRADKDQPRELKPGEGNDVFLDIWSPRPFIAAGGFTREIALEVTAKHPNVLVAFGRHYTSNPDLPERLRLNLPLRHYERPYFYTSGEKGYLGYKKWGDE